MDSTRKYPRTMQEAFGPYTDSQIAERRNSDGVVIWGCTLAAAALAAIMWVWG